MDKAVTQQVRIERAAAVRRAIAKRSDLATDSKVLSDCIEDEALLDYICKDRFHWSSADRWQIVEPGLINLEARYIHNG
jgi:hypothetical protein